MASQPQLRDRQGPGSHINGTWPGSRKHGLPRGIENSGVSCYMNSALQNLAHLPKFCNWIVQHNDPTHGADWPCRPDDPNRKLPVNREEDPAITQMGTGIMQCVACLMKNFIIEYWSYKSKLPNDHRTLRPLQTMADRWFCQSPDAGTLKQKPRESERDFIRRKLAKETAPQRKSRVANARGQQDSDEFLMKMLPAVRESIDPA
jgi:ubiquitin C-terminal hydrolase